uniref:Liver-expressed antimicrobial peptide 2 n=1 Tax=Strix occidentalis caurina TaxID=311401 RepID=A0A8D0FV87_STROC
MAASASVAPGTGRGGRASGVPPGTPTSLVLLLSLLLLLPSSLQVGPGTGGGHRRPAGSSPPSPPHPPLWVLQDLRGAGVHAAPRLPRMTPFWRMVGSRPLGAYCRHSLECVTRACR